MKRYFIYYEDVNADGKIVKSNLICELPDDFRFSHIREIIELDSSISEDKFIIKCISKL